jgi:hypothetical protein
MAAWTQAGVRSWTQAQALTQAGPAAVDTGISLSEACYLEVFIFAELTRTLSGAGTLQAYRKIPVVGEWGRAPGFDLSLVGASGRVWTFPLTSIVSYGQILWCATGVTVSAGTVTVGANVIPYRQ